MKLLIDKNIISKKVILIDNNEIFDFAINFNDEKNLKGNIYKGTVRNVLNDIEAAFVDIGLKKNAFLDFSDLSNKFKKSSKETTNYLYPGKDIFVQLEKVGSNEKGPKVTENISISGKYIVLLPMDSRIYVSKKLKENDDIINKKNLIRNITNDEFGVILRTNSKNASPDLVIRELKSLIDKWENIKRYEKIKLNDPLIYESETNVDQFIKDYFDKIDDIITNSEKDYDLLKKDLTIKSKLKLVNEVDLLDEYDLKNEYNKLINQDIKLENGVSININVTEALTVIDVNSGKYRGNNDALYQVNKEAIKEIARQINVRNIGGIILIDLINLKNKKLKRDLINYLRTCLDRYKSKYYISGITKLGLLEMTKKHNESKLFEKLLVECKNCQRGKIKNPKLVSDEIIIKLMKMDKRSDRDSYLIKTRDDVIEYLKNNDEFKKYIRDNHLTIKYELGKNFELRYLMI